MRIAVAALTIFASVAVGNSAHAANSGRLLNQQVSGTFFRYFVWQESSVTWTFTTSNLSSGSDTVIHVQNYDDPNASFIAGNDDFLGSLSSTVEVPPVGWGRTLLVVVRSYGSWSQGTCTFTATPSSGAPDSRSIFFGGSKESLNGPLQAGAHVTVVERQGGSSDTLLLTLDGFGEHATGFDDDDGTGYMSAIHTPEAATWAWIVVANYEDTGTYNADIVWDDDADSTDWDGDGLGETLEANLSLNAYVADSDSDGLRDGDELLGKEVSGSPPMKFPTWGATPGAKDIFIEADWNPCTAPTCSTLDDNQLGDTSVANTNALVGQVASDLAPVQIHIDIGRANPDSTTWTQWGNWGGASRGNWETGQGCEGTSEERKYHFHHAVVTNTAGGHAWLIPGGCFVTPDAGRIVSHEALHTLGVLHGGRPSKIAANFKPNYMSFMNYNYQNDGSIGYSNGAQPSLNPASLSEYVGLGQYAPDQILAKVQSTFCGSGTEFNGNCVSRNGNLGMSIPNGAVDWNRDGVIDPSGVFTKAAVTVDTAAIVSQTTFGNLRGPSMSWVNVGGAIGNQLWVVGRDVSNNLIQFARVGQSALNACTSFTSYNYEGLGGAGGPFDCAGFGSTTTTLPGNKQTSRTPSIAELGNKLLVVWQAGTDIRSNVININSQSGAVTVDPDVSLPSSSGSSDMDITTLSVGSGRVVAWTRMACIPFPSCIRLKQWIYQNGVWSGPTNQLWMDGSSIQPIEGVSVVQGYADGNSDPYLYALIPSHPDGKVEFAQQEKYGPNAGRWSKLTTSWTILGGSPTPVQPKVSGRPGLAFVPNPSVPTGRFYMSLPLTGCSGNYGTPWNGAGQCPARIYMTEGNLTSGTTKRLKWTTPGQVFTNEGVPFSGPSSLLYSAGRDTNLRAIFQYPNNGVTVFDPLADGIVNATLADQNDQLYVLGALRASLSMDDCQAPSCMWPVGILPASLF